VTVSIPGGFDEPRQLMGEEGLCLACFDQPELLDDMLTTFADTAERVLAPLAAAGVVDRLFVHEDMAGKSGPLLGPRQIRRFIAPYYRRIWQMLAEGGTRLFDQDSDGNMNSVVEAFLEAGVNCMHPIEPAAGMDPVALRREYGDRLAMRGGIDKHVLRRSKPEIAAELRRKIPSLVASGGYEIALDHRIPNGTPLENYRFYVETVWQILDEMGAG
jgi:uroporphyrinogen-III decarboxylase